MLASELQRFCGAVENAEAFLTKCRLRRLPKVAMHKVIDVICRPGNAQGSHREPTDERMGNPCAIQYPVRVP